jgi:hypothetical protein
MAVPAINTKVDQVVEAIESLAIAASRPCADGKTHERYQEVLEARENAATALREFLQPTLRVIEGGQK